jgi:hypothetical protein
VLGSALAALAAASGQLTVQGYAVGHLEGMGPARSRRGQQQPPVSSAFPEMSAFCI